MDAQLPELGIRLFGLNEIGFEDGNPTMTEGRTLPWLQDTEEWQAWDRWGVEYRDVVVVDEQNYPVAVYNLSEHDLAVPDNLDALYTLLVEVATDELPAD